MKTKRAFVTIAFVTAIMAILLVGCEGEQGPQGPTGHQGPAGTSPITVRAQLRTAEIGDNDTLGEASVYIASINEIPNVQINGILIPYNIIHGWAELAFESQDFSISAGDQAQLIVIYGDFDTVSADINMPSLSEFVSPESDSLLVGDYLTFAWTLSSNARAYQVQTHIYIIYMDTAGYQHTSSVTLDSFTTQTEITFSPDLAFPELAQISQVLGGHCAVVLWAISGPVFEGDNGNVEGDGIGMFNGWTNSAVGFFYWVETPHLIMSPQRPQSLLSCFFSKE